MKEIGKCECGWKGPIKREPMNNAERWECPKCRNGHYIIVRKIPAFHNEKGERINLIDSKAKAIEVRE